MNPVYAAAPLLSQTAVNQSLAINVPMVIAVADETGELLHFVRMADALPASRTLAINKAYTAAALRMPTHEAGQLAQPGAVLYGIQNALDGRAVLFGGGFPLAVAGKVVGAAGISGGTVAQDMEVGQAVLRSWECLLAASQTLLTALAPDGLRSGIKATTLAQLAGQLQQQHQLPQQVRDLLVAAVQMAPSLEARSL